MSVKYETKKTNKGYVVSVDGNKKAIFLSQKAADTFIEFLKRLEKIN